MPRLMKFLAITLAVLFTATNAANAWFIPEPNSIGSIEVALGDNARNACWTNLRQAREYAEEKLVIERYDVLADDGEYIFNISVTGGRDIRGMCIGYVEVSISAGSIHNGVVGLHFIGEEGGTFVRPGDLNNAVIEVISTMVGQM
jgi:hypothetical protein